MSWWRTILEIGKKIESDKKPFLISHTFFKVTDRYKLIPEFNFPYNNLI